jgi:2-desacetyl-2-hydroxyethyl bacteriochlorophyllide A dehydrogenase
LKIDGPRALRIELVAEPSPKRDEVLVRVLSAGICGSDVHGYVGLNGRRPAGTVMGHEAAGTVVELGPDVDAGLLGAFVTINPVVSCGECDSCRAGRPNVCHSRRLYGCTPELPGAFADEVVVAAANVVPMPAGVPSARAALVEPLSVGAHAVAVGAPRAEDRVLVIGGGPIGIAAALAASRVATDVSVSEPDAERRSLLESLGLTTIAPAGVDDERADVVLECVGFEQTIDAALTAARPGGTVVLVGLASERLSVDAPALVMGERRLLGSAVYTPQDFADVAAWVASTPVALEAMVQADVGLHELPDAFAAYADGRLRAVKTMVHVDER